MNEKSPTTQLSAARKREIKLDESQFRDPCNYSQSFSCSSVPSRLNRLGRTFSSFMIPEKIFRDKEDDRLQELVAQSKTLLEKKKKFSDFLNVEDDLFVKEGIEDCRWETLAEKYELLYKRSKALKRLFAEVVENNQALIEGVQGLLQEKVFEFFHLHELIMNLEQG